jgi:hypothetical protein
VVLLLLVGVYYGCVDPCVPEKSSLTINIPKSRRAYESPDEVDTTGRLAAGKDLEMRSVEQRGSGGGGYEAHPSPGKNKNVAENKSRGITDADAAEISRSPRGKAAEGVDGESVSIKIVDVGIHT